jgi:ABC-2 type transport system permease protein
VLGDVSLWLRLSGGEVIDVFVRRPRSGARGEETRLRAEPVLATPLSRLRWVSSHLAVALAGSVNRARCLRPGCQAQLRHRSRGPGPGARLLGAALAYAPALWLLAGLAAALFGLAPRGVSAAWAALAACFVIGLLGEVLDLPAWLNHSVVAASAIDK